MPSRCLLSILIAACLIIVTGGCQTGKQPMKYTNSDDLELAEAGLPDYSVGEFFSFDDGTPTVVTAISNEKITWRYNNGATSTGYRNFILPALEWKSANSHSKTTSTAPVDMLWPLLTGNQSQYESHQIISKKDQIESTERSRKWSCAVEGIKRVNVPAGSFDTYIIACQRYSNTSNTWRATRRYYYAPDLGHYVVREDRYRSRPDQTRKLVTYGFNSTFLSERDQINLNRELQKTLNNNPDGVAGIWKNKLGDITAMLIPVSSYAGINSSQCRDYYSVYSLKGRIRKNVRSVCKLPDGQWQRVD